MQSLSLHTHAPQENEPVNLAREIERLETVLRERRAELSALREELHEFKALYMEVVGSRLAALAELERALQVAETRAFGVEPEASQAEADETDESDAGREPARPVAHASLRKLFWSVARLFHPDRAANEEEARRRHTIMAAASRAYQEGDALSLHTLLSDEEMKFSCAATAGTQATEEMSLKLLRLQDELRTLDFGLKRIRQDGLYLLKLKVASEAAQGRDWLAHTASGIDRQIVKAQRRLDHLS